jgi:hypothetical protein
MKLTTGIIILLISHTLFAKSYLDVVIEATSKIKTRSSSKQEMRDNAVNEVAVKYIRELIGETKYNQNFQVINSSILKNTGKYIPYVKDSDFEKTENGHQMNVSVKLSIDDLKQVLLNHGLLYKLKGQPRVVPFIQIVDHINSANHTWWTAEKSTYNPFLIELLRQLHQQLTTVFSANDFYHISPIAQDMATLLPEALHTENMLNEDHVLASDFLGAQIMLVGQVSIYPKKDISDVYLIKMKIKALQSGNSRIIAEITRQYQTDIGSFKSVVQKKFIEASEKIAKDLSIQILESWQKGTFGANLLKLTLNGKWPYKELMRIKNGISKLKNIKGLRERLFSPQGVTFDVDVAMGAKQFSKSLSNKKIKGYRLLVDSVKEDEVFIRAKHIPGT